MLVFKVKLHFLIILEELMLYLILEQMFQDMICSLTELNNFQVKNQVFTHDTA